MAAIGNQMHIISAINSQIIVKKTKVVKMKLLIMFPSKERGGAEEYCLRMARGALSEGWEVHVAFSEEESLESLLSSFKSLGAVFHPLTYKRGYRMRLHIARDTFQTFILLRKVRPDRILIQLPGAQAGAPFLFAAAAFGAPTAIVFQMVRRGLHFTSIQRWVRRICRSRRQRYIAVSKDNRRLLSSYFALDNNSIALIPNGVPIAKFRKTTDESTHTCKKMRMELGLAQESQIVLMIGRIAHQKGYDILIKSARQVVAEFPEVCFVCIGEGHEKESILRLVHELRLESNFVFLGRRDDISDLLHTADLFVHPSRFEGQPFALLEAMASGVPVVATRASGVDELITHEANGLLSEVDDITGLAKNLCYALSHRTEMEQLSGRAFNTVKAYDEENMIKSTLNLLTSFDI